MISSSCCSTIVSHWRTQYKQLLKTAQFTVQVTRFVVVGCIKLLLLRLFIRLTINQQNIVIQGYLHQTHNDVSIFFLRLSRRAALKIVLTANFKLAVTLESSVASERSIASPLRDFTLMYDFLLVAESVCSP